MPGVCVSPSQDGSGGDLPWQGPGRWWCRGRVDRISSSPSTQGGVGAGGAGVVPAAYFERLAQIGTPDPVLCEVVSVHHV
jgi:hypothetical protein